MHELDATIASHFYPDLFQGHDLLRIRVRGACMSPFLLPDDIVVVRKVDCADLKMGAIVVYRAASKNLVVHRFLGWAEEPGAPLLKMKGDLSTEDIEYLKPEDLVGLVVAVQRGPRIIAVDTWYWRFLGVLSERTRPISSMLFPPKYLPHKLAAVILTLLQCVGIYRRLAWRLIGGRVRFRAATSEDLMKLAAPSDGPRSQSEPSYDWGAKDETSSTVVTRTHVAILDEDIVGYVCSTQIPQWFDMKPSCRITIIWVRGRYRGAGIGRGLLMALAEDLVEEGINNLCGFTLGQNTPMVGLARYLDAVRPLEPGFTDEQGEPVEMRDRKFLTAPLLEGFRDLDRRGVLRKYCGQGCCDRIMERLRALNC